MSRLTAAQIVAQGDYLKPDFDPASLTIAQLLGVFGHHNIRYPAQYNKSTLVRLWNEEIKPNAKRLLKERIKRENSQASEDGITDGMTGRPLNEGKNPVRRSSRRLSKTPALEQVEPAPKPKRRRASAEPSLGGPSRRRAAQPVEPVLVEESEPEEEPVVRKVGRPKKAAADAGSQARRVSRPLTDEPESGWEDNNVFQSGTESSPLRPSPVRPRPRKSSAGARPAPKSRKSMSAPPQISPPSPPTDKGKERERLPSVKPPESDFEPKLPSAVFQARRLSVVRDLKEEDEDEVSPSAQPIASLADSLAEAGVEVPTDVEGVPEYERAASLDEESVDAVAQRIAEGGSLVTRDAQPDPPRPNWFLQLLVTLLLLTGSGIVVQYKQESAQIGFCDAGTSTNSILNGMREYRAAIESCNRENRTTLHVADATHTISPPPPRPTATALSADPDVSAIVAAEACPPPPLIPGVQPDECTPCPKHANCTADSIVCENGYILKPHPLLAFLPVPSVRKETANGVLQAYERPAHISSGSSFSELVYAAIHFVLDGAPYVGPVALPPRCVEDPRRKRHIGVLGKAIESILANERGRRVCEGLNFGLPEGDEATEAQRWGLEVEKLREHIKEKTPPHMLTTLDDTFNEAVGQLLQWGGVFMGEDATGKRFLAHKTPVMSWQCSARVKAREAWAEWRRSTIGSLVLILSILTVRRRQAKRAIEDEQVATLVTVALDSLRNQEFAHHTDPVMVPRPYLSSLQLRDLVLQDIHDVSKRKRLWSRVERVVEANANVRTNLQEVEGGDEQRVWEWVGSTGKTLPLETPGIRRLGFGEGGRVVA
ncbi:Man1-Src1p-C-terminal domain-containing protein [Dichomitus squalens]|nr:Man1-Src1p-C-terminal domain-containing protein [Dichomitus squalens]